MQHVSDLCTHGCGTGRVWGPSSGESGIFPLVPAPYGAHMCQPAGQPTESRRAASRGAGVKGMGASLFFYVDNPNDLRDERVYLSIRHACVRDVTYFFSRSSVILTNKRFDGGNLQLGYYSNENSVDLCLYTHAKYTRDRRIVGIRPEAG